MNSAPSTPTLFAGINRARRLLGGACAVAIVPLCAPSVSAAAAAAHPGAPSVSAAAAAAHPGAPPPRSVVLAFLPSRPGSPLELQLARAPGLSLAIMSAAEGSYSAEQLMLDITQGARIASAAYPDSRPPALAVEQIGGGAVVRGWGPASTRAAHAPQLLRPGLLAASIPGGAAYAGIDGTSDVDAAAAADRQGRIAAVSLGAPGTLLRRISALHVGSRLVVCDLPAGVEGDRDLRALAEGRVPGELLIVLQRVGDGPGGELLWMAGGGLEGGGGRELSSSTTNEHGLIASIDLAPTILAHLGAARLPADMRGAQIHSSGRLALGSLGSLMARLRVIGARRLKALAFLLCGWLALIFISAIWPDGNGSVRRAWAMRAGALGVLWAPAVAMADGALEPTAAVEYATITVACLGLGALTDATVRWPRAPIAPAAVTIAALVADALPRSQLLMRSLVGPDPILGARFYGIGNELKSGLAVLVLGACAAALHRPHAPERLTRGRLRSAAATIAVTGAALAAIEGWARIGAAVGGVILVCAGTAVAAVMLLPGRLTRRRALVALLTPLAGLVALAALDLATAHGSGHFTGSILHARSAGDLRDVLVRRYGAAWRELRNHAMPAATAIALLAVALALRAGDRLLAPVRGDLVWRAALAGGLSAGIVGALVEDSGPVLLVVAVFALACLLAYLWGQPPPSRSPGRRRAARSRASRRSTATPG